MPTPTDSKSRIGKYGIGKCRLCEKEFNKTKPWQEFCNPKHRDKWHNIKKLLDKIGVTP